MNHESDQPAPAPQDILYRGGGAGLAGQANAGPMFRQKKEKRKRTALHVYTSD